MRRLEEYLREKLKDPEFAAAFWEAEAQHPLISNPETFPELSAPHLSYAGLMLLPPAEHHTPTVYERPSLRVIRTSAN
jgi:hypothetical protein